MVAAPDAYWAIIDWRSIVAALGGAGGIGAVAAPFVREWWASRTKGLETAAKAAETSAERVERIQREQYDRISAERDKAAAALAAERAAWDAERDALERDRDDGWALGRGMEDEAHQQRHAHVHLVMRFNALRGMFEQLATGLMSVERALAFMPEIKPAADPPRVPLLRDVARKQP